MLHYSLTGQQKIGAFVTLFGIGFFLLGLLLFFDRGLLGVGNLGILIGTIIGIGTSNTVSLFRRAGILSSVFYFVGFFLVLFGWIFAGLLVESIGAVNSFGAVLPVAITAGRYVPIVSSILQFPGVCWVADKISPVE